MPQTKEPRKKKLLEAKKLRAFLTTFLSVQAPRENWMVRTKMFIWKRKQENFSLKKNILADSWRHRYGVVAIERNWKRENDIQLPESTLYPTAYGKLFLNETYILLYLMCCLGYMNTHAYETEHAYFDNDLWHARLSQLKVWKLTLFFVSAIIFDTRFSLMIAVKLLFQTSLWGGCNTYGRFRKNFNFLWN